MRKVLKYLSHAEEILMSLCVLIVVIINFANIMARYVFDLPLGPSQEIMVYIFVWITFLGIPLATRQRQHLGLSLFTDNFGPIARRVLIVFTVIVTLFFLAGMGYYGYKMVVMEIASKQTSPALGLPVWWFGMAVPVSAVLTAIRLFEAAYEDLFPSREVAK